MEGDKQDTFARAYARLSSLRKNIGDIKYGIEEKYVYEYHEILDKLERLEIDVSEFRIQNSEIAPHIKSFNTLTGEKSFSREKYVDKSFILTKLDAILGYFEIITSKEPRKMGFNQPEK